MGKRACKDAIIGSEALVTESILPSGNMGQVYVGKTKDRWSAYSDEYISVGEMVRIADVKGTKVIVEKASD